MTDSSQARVGTTGKMYIAPINTAWPANVTDAPSGAWTDVGDLRTGPSLKTAIDSVTITSWQSGGKSFRTVVKSEVRTWDFDLLQRNKSTWVAVFGGTLSAVAGHSGQTKWVPPTAIAARSFAAIVEITDGTVVDRYYLPVATITAIGDMKISNEDVTSFPITVTENVGATEPGVTMVTNDAAMV